MVAAIAGVGMCTECLEKRYDLNDDGQCGYCERFFSRAVPPAPPWPTDALPGTAEKVEVMLWRDDNGFSVSHKNDRTDDPRPNLPTDSNWPWFRPLEVTVHRSTW